MQSSSGGGITAATPQKKAIMNVCAALNSITLCSSFQLGGRGAVNPSQKRQNGVLPLEGKPKTWCVARRLAAGREMQGDANVLTEEVLMGVGGSKI